MLLTSDRLQRHALPDPPEQQPDSNDGEMSWLVYLDKIAARLELHEIPGEWGDGRATGSGGSAQLALRVAPEPVEEATGLPLSFSLCADANVR